MVGWFDSGSVSRSTLTNSIFNIPPQPLLNCLFGALSFPSLPIRFPLFLHFITYYVTINRLVNPFPSLICDRRIAQFPPMTAGSNLL
jgi:hypothetical protein